MAYPPSAWYVNFGNGSSTGYYGVAAWAALTSYAAGTLIRQATTPTVGNERIFVQTNPTIHTSGASEPSWTVTKGAANTDATCTWVECTGQPGVNGDTSANCPSWAASQTPALGQIIQALVSATVTLQICTTSGAGGTGAAPSFSSTAGTTTADASATWTSLGAASGFAAWAAPAARLASMFAANWSAAGNTFFVGDNHAETQASAITATCPGTNAAVSPIYCVDHTASVPPGSANLKTTATVTTTGNSAITLSGAFAYYGITFQAGTGAVNAAINLNNSTSFWERFDQCSLQKLGTSANGAALNFNGGYTELHGTSVEFGNAADGIKGNNGSIANWYNTSPFFLGTPTSNWNSPGGSSSQFNFEGVDFSALSSGTLFNNTTAPSIVCVDCKIAGGITFASTPNTPAQGSVDATRTDSAGTSYQAYRYRYAGTLLTSTTVVRTGGASDGTTPISWSLATTANSTWLNPLVAFPISIWNTLTGTNQTVTLYGIWFGAALPNNDQIWHDVEYLGAASSPLASLGSGTKANNLASGSAWTADASAWDSQATARQNSHAYSVGNIIKVADNPGRLFYCTASSGNSAASEPGGYASAVDGGSVTDGSCTFRAGWRFAMTVTLSAPQPALVGYLRSYVKAALASSTFYIDPLIVL